MNAINLILEDLKNQGFENQIKLLKIIEGSNFTNEEKMLFFATLSNYNDGTIVLPNVNFKMPKPGQGNCWTRWCTECGEFQACSGNCSQASGDCGFLYLQDCTNICVGP